MIRLAQTNDACRAEIDMALRERVRAETGLSLGALTPLGTLGPVVTRYTAKGAQRYTLVTAFENPQPKRGDLHPTDGSIKAASWMVGAVDFQAFAPANRLILGHLLWPHLSDAGQQAMRHPITQAVEACTLYAAEADVSPPSAPWASSAKILDWSLSWPQPK